ncbi:hypothetical protein HUJ05_011879 [Dendroctonus ponderosae]|nr:hypothetical protein HUJ05_011879 [Dendroctonus ponderosae]
MGLYPGVVLLGSQAQPELNMCLRHDNSLNSGNDIEQSCLDVSTEFKRLTSNYSFGLRYNWEVLLIEVVYLQENVDPMRLKCQRYNLVRIRLLCDKSPTAQLHVRVLNHIKSIEL